jgi:tau tubulin kinase
VVVYHAQSNFVVGLTTETWGDVYIIDFGLARKYVGPDGEIKESRDQAGFRGTARYASINSHLSKDLGRRDDLWSVLYILIEFLTGTLPWRKQKDKDRIGEIKMKFNGPELVAELPPEFLQFMNHLRGLEYSDRPDYDYLTSILQSRFQKAGGTDDTLYDWQQGDHPTAAGGPGLTASQSASRVREPHGEDGEDGADENSLQHDLSDDEKSEGASPFKKPDPRRESGGRYGLAGASSKAEREASGPTSPLSSDHPFSGSNAHHSGASGHAPGVYKLVANKKMGNSNSAAPHYPSITGSNGPNATNRRAGVGNDSDREDAPLKGDRGDSSEGDRAERDHDSDDSDNENHLDRSSDDEAPVKTKSAARRQRSYRSSVSDHSEESVAMGSLKAKAERVAVAKKRKKTPLCNCIVM